MRVNKFVREPMDIIIDSITLLSAEEYKAHGERIKPIDDWWWLRSPVGSGISAASVYHDGSVSNGSWVDNDFGSVRPVVVLRLNPESPNLRIGDCLAFADHTWTMISDTMALCDEGVGCTCFRADWRAQDANDYEKSDVKKWLEKWARDNGIVMGE